MFDRFDDINLNSMRVAGKLWNLDIITTFPVESHLIDYYLAKSYVFESIFYTSSSTHTAEKDTMDIYNPLLEQYSVDLARQAHNHNHQRTRLISYNSGEGSKPTISNQFTANYSGQSDGIGFAKVGIGGEDFCPIDSQAAFTATFNHLI